MRAELAVGGSHGGADQTIHLGCVRVCHWINALAILVTPSPSAKRETNHDR
jgi:hypothetical protein